MSDDAPTESPAPPDVPPVAEPPEVTAEKVAGRTVRKVAPPVAGVMALFFVLGWLRRRRK